MTPLQRLNARIIELEAARDELQSALVGLESAPPPPPPALGWESRLSAARAVDSLTGANTAQAIEAQRQADTATREKQARQAVQDAARATQAREGIDTLARDLDAAHALMSRELTAVANGQLSGFESDYHRARDKMLTAAERYAGCLALCNRETEAHQLLRAAGAAGDTMTVVARRAVELRAQLLNETEEHENA